MITTTIIISKTFFGFIPFQVGMLIDSFKI